MPKATRLENKWVMKIFGKKADLVWKLLRIQDLETKICDMTAESNFLADKVRHGSMQDTGESLQYLL